MGASGAGLKTRDFNMCKNMCKKVALATRIIIVDFGQRGSYKNHEAHLTLDKEYNE